jgi:hypothetical protein
MQPKVISRHPHEQILMVMLLYLSVEDSVLLLQMLGKLMANTAAQFSSEIYAVMLGTSYTPVFKKRPNFLNSSPTSTEGALRLLGTPSGRF